MSIVTKGTALAPSKHLRTMLVTALGATLALSACGAQQGGAAAIVDGTVISDKDVQTVSLQLNKLAQGQAKLPVNTVILSLILAPYVSQEADRTGKKVTDAQVLKLISKVGKPAPATMEFVRMQLAVQTLDQSSRTAILTQLLKAKISVNPRYGRFDAKQVALVPTSSNWLKASATPVPK